MLDTKISEVPAISKILLGVIIGLAIAGFIYALIVKNEGPKATTLTAEQQQNITELQMATRGDIIAYPNKTRYLIVRKVYVDADADHRRSLLVSYFHLGFTEGQELRTQDELTRLNCRVIHLNSDEWVQIMRRSFSTDPDSLSK